MKHATFNSDNATMKHQLENNNYLMLRLYDHNLKTAGRASKGNLQSPKVRVAMADYARIELARQAIPEAVIVDYREAYHHLSEQDTEALAAMVKDVENWDEINMPFPAMIVRYEDEEALLVMEVEDETSPEDLYYNVLACTKLSEKTKVGEIALDKTGSIGEVLVKGWTPTSAAFQIKADSPKQYAFDAAYTYETEKYRKNTDLMFKGSKVFLYCMLFLLKHEKLETPSVRVPTSRNTKRLKRNQAPYSEYRVAHLGHFGTPYKYLDQRSEDEKGHHASPKMHIRKGHWRRKPMSEDKIWIHSTVVGDPSRGIVIKEYKA